MKNFEVNSLFPVPFYTSEVELDLEDIRKRIEKLARYQEGLNDSNGYIYPKNEQLFGRKEFSDVKNEAKKHVDRFMREVLKYDYDDSFFACSWFNINEPGSHHHRHYHPNSIISGVIFITNPPNSGHLLFNSPHQRDIILEQKKGSVDTPFSSGIFSPRQEVGCITLFPSWLEHAVSKNLSDENRLTIAFNVFVKGHIGSSHTLTYCEVGG
jgi:uncharacterized protein (TIGR02466 family)